MMIGQRRFSYRLVVAAITSFAVVAAASGQQDVVTAQGYDWIKIGDPGNPAYQGNIQGVGTGRGSVDYTYRMSKMEVSSGQWLEFIQFAAPLVGDPTFGAPDLWGYLNLAPGVYIPNAPYPEQTPVQGITWREAAMYANWMHNGQAKTLDAIMNGAYDVSTFGDNPDGSVSDQRTRNPDAKFWIPSLDEWLKAAHWDPNKNGEGDGGWWQYSTTSDTAPVPGIPGEGETSAGVIDWEFEGISAGGHLIPLGAYPETLSPWGLLDITGGGAEWTEELIAGQIRITSGSIGGRLSFLRHDNIKYVGGAIPGDTFYSTIRLATSIPAPSSGICLTFITWFSQRRKR